jgi:hypothetical protein
VVWVDDVVTDLEVLALEPLEFEIGVDRLVN